MKEEADIVMNLLPVEMVRKVSKLNSTQRKFCFHTLVSTCVCFLETILFYRYRAGFTVNLILGLSSRKRLMFIEYDSLRQLHRALLYRWNQSRHRTSHCTVLLYMWAMECLATSGMTQRKFPRQMLHSVRPLFANFWGKIR